MYALFKNNLVIAMLSWLC